MTRKQDNPTRSFRREGFWKDGMNLSIDLKAAVAPLIESVRYNSRISSYVRAECFKVTTAHIGDAEGEET